MYTIIKTTYEENNFNLTATKTLIPAIFEDEAEAEEKILTMAQGEMVQENYEAMYIDYEEDNFHVFAEYRIMKMVAC